MGLPAELLGMVCQELANQRAWGTLFNCALSNKEFASEALPNLYQVHSDFLDLIRDQSTVDDASRWALLWKSIIRSSLGHTVYPYCLYIRSLNLNNLNDLLDDGAFLRHQPAFQSFFAEDMAIFLSVLGTPAKPVKRGQWHAPRLNWEIILDLVGQSITNYVNASANQNNSKAALEHLSGKINSAALQLWTTRLSKLKSMNIWDGAALNESVGTAIFKSCPQFAELEMYSCVGSAADHTFSTFLSALKPNSLTSFTIFRSNNFGSETLLGLSLHSQSLKKVILNSLPPEAIKNLNLLQGCEALEILQLQDRDGLIDLEATENDVYLEVVAWLKRCTQLRDIVFDNIVSASAILAEVCLNNSTRLRKLEVNGHVVLGSQDFHRALSHQTSLESLTLRGNGLDIFRDDIDIMVSSICHLRKLKHLDLVGTSEYFSTSEIRRLALELLELEKLAFSGYGITDNVLPSLAGLHYLRELNISALTEFTADGLLNYISTLQDTNQGLELFVLYQNERYDLTKKEQARIRAAFTKKVNGKFEFELHREPNEQEFPSDSD